MKLIPTEFLVVAVGAVALLSATVAFADDHKHLSDSADRAAEAAKDWKRNSTDDLRAKKESHDNEREWLRDQLQHEMRKLGDHASKQQIDAVVKRFKDDHAERIADEQRVAKELAAELKAGIPDTVPAEVSEFRTEFTKVKAQGREARAVHKAQLLTAVSKDERDQLRSAFREEQRAYHHDIKEALKKIRTETRNGSNHGDRRIDE